MLERIQKIIADELNIDEGGISLDTRLQEDLGADSIDAMNIVMRIEEDFSVTVSDEEIARIKTVSDILDSIKS